MSTVEPFDDLFAPDGSASSDDPIDVGNDDGVQSQAGATKRKRTAKLYFVMRKDDSTGKWDVWHSLTRKQARELLEGPGMYTERVMVVAGQFKTFEVSTQVKVRF